VPETPPTAQFNGTLGGQSGSQNPTLTTPNLAESQGLSQATRRLLLADASSTQDTSSPQSKSYSRSRTFSPTGSPLAAQTVTPAVSRGSFNKKRVADLDIGGIPPKRRNPAVISPWIRRIDGTEE
jgi:hypothetical protein